ncbi:hypothetical protein WR25_14095 [Diploscapter pachys]|uniref:Zinc metalloproteinase n=1 Tax=Diploscapter pachys TaxID=2018661 RepID=A0A2A2K807_9BILA|nr:hypothetical protein WR25_14095 [Diploscapter pachys]
MHLLSLLTFTVLLTLFALVNSRSWKRIESVKKKLSNVNGPTRRWQKIDPKNMTEEECEQYRRKYGINPLRAAARLQRLQKRGYRGEHRMSKQDYDTKEKIHKVYEEVIVEKPDGDEVGDLFEVNEMTGVSDLLVEGDINLTDEQFADLVKDDNSTRSKRQVTMLYPRWTNKNVYYYFDSSITPLKKQHIMAGINYIQSRTCVSFHYSTTAPNRIRFIAGNGCYSSVGMIGGVQDLSLGKGCDSIGTVVHETMHALGVFHMQSRYDRDWYVNVNLSNIPVKQHYNFNKYTSSQATYFTPYEWGSSMHYSADAFASRKGKPSMIPLNEDYLFTIGNKQVSFYDIQLINLMYSCMCLHGPTCSHGASRHKNPAKAY